MSKIKLSDKQKEVIKDLQAGFILATDCDTKGATVSNYDKSIKPDYHINNGVFWRLVHKGLIFQNAKEQHSYTLTELGKTSEL